MVSSSSNPDTSTMPDTRANVSRAGCKRDDVKCLFESKKRKAGAKCLCKNKRKRKKRKKKEKEKKLKY